MKMNMWKKALFFVFSVVIAGEAYASDFVHRSGSKASVNWAEDVQSIQSGLKVFWWNTACNSTKGFKKLSEDQRQNELPENQWKNLETLIADEDLRPDVLILGEYCPKYFQHETYEEITAIYPHVFRLKKSNELYGIRNGLRVFSLTPLKTKKMDVLSGEASSFLSSRKVKECKAEKRRASREFKVEFWNRPWIELEVSKDDKTYSFVPIHLANPWPFKATCAGVWDTGFEMLSGKDNPNYAQAKYLADFYRDKERTLLLGDFNASRDLILGSAKSYSVLRSALGASLIESEEPTFFDYKRGMGDHSIDHAFASEDLDVNFAEVLPLAGSDHLPLYIVVE